MTYVPTELKKEISIEKIVTIHYFEYMKEFELSWVGDFNPKMRALMDATGADDGKIHLTYRYLFDPEKRAEQQRAGSIPADTKYKLAEKE